MASEASGSARARYGFLVLKALLTVTLLTVIVWKVGLASMLAALRRLPVPTLGLALLLSILFIVGRSWKWMVVARAETPGLRLRDATRSLVGGMSLGIVTPGRLGEVTRIGLMSGDRLVLAGLFALDRAIDLVAIVLFGSLALFGLGYPAFGAAGVALTSAVVGLLYVGHRLERPLSRVAARLPLASYSTRALRALGGTGARRLTAAVLVSLVATAVGYVQFWVLLRPYADLSVSATVFCFTALILSNLVPISIGGIGVREALAALILDRYGVSQAVAVNAALLSYITNTVLPGIVGTFIVSQPLKTTREAGVS